MSKDVVSVVLYKGRLDFEGVGEINIVETIKDQEIINVNNLESLVSKFVTEKKLQKKKVKLVLAPEVVYSKTILATDNVDTTFETEKFINDIPFERPNLAIKEVKTQTEIKVWVANKHLFYPIVHILGKLGLHVLEVSPEGSGVNLLEEVEVSKKGHGWLWAGLFVAIIGTTVAVLWNMQKTKPATVVEVAPVISPVEKLEVIEEASSEAEVATSSAT